MGHCRSNLPLNSGEFPRLMQGGLLINLQFRVRASFLVDYPLCDNYLASGG